MSRRRRCRLVTSPTTSSAGIKPFQRARSCCCSTAQRTGTRGIFPTASVLTSIAEVRTEFRAGFAFSVWVPHWRACRHVWRPKNCSKRWPDWEVDYSNAEMAHTSSVRGWGKLPATFS